MRLLSGAAAHILFAVRLAFVLAALCSHAELTRAHEGHDHGDRPAAEGAVLASPRVVAASESYQFVGIVEGEVLVIYLDRAADNEPVTAATVEVSLNGEPFKAEPQKSGTYEVTAPVLKSAGTVEVLVNVTDSGTSDLLVGGLVIPSSHADNLGQASGLWPRLAALFARATAMNPSEKTGSRFGSIAAMLLAAGIGAAIAVAVLAGFRMRRRRLELSLLLAAALSITLAASALAHEGHDHGADLKASTGNSPQRRPDGTIFLPKPSQRLLEVRTEIVEPRNTAKVVRLTGRIAANPNFSGVVQSTIPGRYEAPAGGVPPLGARVKAGDALGRIAPAFASVDASDMAQTLGDVEQKLSIARAKLARQEQLLRTNVVAPALVDETRMEVAGFVKRRADLLAARVRFEELVAPVDGVIASSRAMPGQVVAQADKIFEIIDPSRVLVEAMVFDQVDPDTVSEATAMISGDVTVKLRVLGRSRALQQHYALMQFEVIESAVPLNVGMPVAVIARTGTPVSGLFVPRAALAQAPNGQTVVFEHKEPEVFVPRAVRIEPFDSHVVLVTGGLEPGTKIVIRNAPLVNQVR